MIGTRFQVIDSATPALEDLLAKGENLTPLMDRWGGAVASLVKQGFISSHSPYGVPWAALKLRKGQPLRDKGALMNSITWNASSNSVIVGPSHGPSSKGAAVQQFGATIVPRNGAFLRFKVNGRWFSLRQVTIPARPYLPTKQGGLPADWHATLLRETAAYLMGSA